jgi:hypothetical protein
MEPIFEILAEIAHRHLNIPTLENRRSDNLDFHEVSVWSVKDALWAAYDAGVNTADMEGNLVRKMLRALQMASNYMADDRDEGDETEIRVFRTIRSAIAEATATDPASDPATSDEPARFEIEHDPAENSDRVYVVVDGKFDVAIIRTDEGIVVDVYPKDEFQTIATTYAFDSDVEQESSTN